MNMEQSLFTIFHHLLSGLFIHLFTFFYLFCYFISVWVKSIQYNRIYPQLYIICCPKHEACQYSEYTLFKILSSF